MKNKNMLITGGIILALIIVGIVLVTFRNKSGGLGKASEESILPETEVIPTVDSSVKVELTSDKLMHEATLTVSHFPKGTQEIEYALSYDALIDGESVPKGVIGTLEIEDGKDSVSKEITLGTCSSGTCKYDKIASKVSVELKFQGDYGARLYIGDFDL